jgi:hypothetical protein
MISLIAAVALSLFTLVASPAGIKSTFALNGYVNDAAGNPTVTAIAPTLSSNEDGPIAQISFVSPIKGTCVSALSVTVDGKEQYIPLGKADTDKNETIITDVELPTPEDLTPIGVTSTGYTILIGCVNTSDKNSKMIFSNYYHIDPLPTGKAV